MTDDKDFNATMARSMQHDAVALPQWFGAKGQSPHSNPRNKRAVVADETFYDLSDEDMSKAMSIWAETGGDWFAQSYRLTLRAEDCDRRIAFLSKLPTPAGLVAGFLKSLPLRYERAALRAQAHQCFSLAVALRKGRQPGTEYDPDEHKPDPALMDRAYAQLFRRINCAHGHGGLYGPTGA